MSGTHKTEQPNAYLGMKQMVESLLLFYLIIFEMAKIAQ